MRSVNTFVILLWCFIMFANPFLLFFFILWSRQIQSEIGSFTVKTEPQTFFLIPLRTQGGGASTNGPIYQPTCTPEVMSPTEFAWAGRNCVSQHKLHLLVCRWWFFYLASVFVKLFVYGLSATASCLQICFISILLTRILWIKSL